METTLVTLAYDWINATCSSNLIDSDVNKHVDFLLDFYSKDSTIEESNGELYFYFNSCDTSKGLLFESTQKNRPHTLSELKTYLANGGEVTFGNRTRSPCSYVIVKVTNALASELHHDANGYLSMWLYYTAELATKENGPKFLELTDKDLIRTIKGQFPNCVEILGTHGRSYLASGPMTTEDIERIHTYIKDGDLEEVSDILITC